MISATEIFALAVVALFVKMLGVAFFQGAVRTMRDQFVRPEDAKSYGSGHVADQDVPAADRAQRALRNDVENIPIFLFLGWCALQLDVSPTYFTYYTGIFVVARLVHTITYLKPLQPYRTLAYATGTLMSLALSAHILAAVLA
jgi:glutathione S-transferase